MQKYDAKPSWEITQKKRPYSFSKCKTKNKLRELGHDFMQVLWKPFFERCINVQSELNMFYPGSYLTVSDLTEVIPVATTIEINLHPI